MSTNRTAAAASARHRPHLSPGRPHRIYPRLSDEENALVAEAARQAGLTAAGYAAQAVVAAARSNDPAFSSGGELQELQRELFAARRAVNMFGSNVNQAAAASSRGQVPGWAGESVRLCADAVARLDALTARIDRRLR
ncbi:hypothetical protein AB0B10_25720 [Micromonospora arborensis]|uniref:hypothetical protein n=1 Tax=Micromonospora arborensis TaxID=2116518 RepID=UPI0033D834B1